MENNNYNAKSFSFFKLIKANLLLLILITILFGLIGTFLGVMYAKPVYKASRSVILRTEIFSNTNEETTNVSLAFLIIGQLEYHFTSADYIELANEEYLKNPEAKGVISSGNIIIEYKENSFIFTLSYQDLDKETAISKLKAVFNAAETYFENVNINAQKIALIPTDNADADDSRFAVSVSDNMAMYIILGTLAGIVLAIMIILIKNAFDNTVHDREELEELTNSNLLACIEKR